MNNPWPFRFAILVAIAFVAVLVTGTVVTDQSATGAVFVSPLSASAGLVIHRHAAEALVMLLLILAIWVLVASRHGSVQSWVKTLCWTALAGVLVEVYLGSASLPLSSALAFFHAFFALLVFGILVSCTVLLWPSWAQKGTPLADRGWPPLRSLSRTTVILLVIQLALGAAFRHNLAGVLWHILGAFLVVLFAMALLVLLTQTPGGQSMRPAMITLAVLLGAQVALGMVLISISDPSKRPALALYSTIAHILSGAATFAVTILTAMLIRRAVDRPGG